MSTPSYDPELAQQNRLLRELQEAFPGGKGLFGKCEIVRNDKPPEIGLYIKVESDGRITKASYDPNDIKG